jgi:hypothetical protein
MRRALSATPLIAYLLLPASLIRAAEEPRTLVEKGVQALGGEAQLRRCKAAELKIKGIVQQAPFTGQVIMQLPHQVKQTLDIDEATISTMQILNKDQGWIHTAIEEGDKNKEVEPARGAELTGMKHSAYKDYVADLLPLLDDKSFALSPAGETKIDNRFYPGVRVRHEGHPDVKVYFSLTTGFPVKTAYRAIDPDTMKEVLWEEELKDYREANPPEADEAAIKAAKIATDNSALLDYLRKATLPAKTREKIKSLIQGLRSTSFQVREKAKTDLIAQGAAATALLTQVLNDRDPEVAGTAKECLQKIGKASDATVVAAVARLLARHRPTGAAEVLRNYLPCAPDEASAQYVQSALAALEGDGKLKSQKPGQRLFMPGVKRAMKGVQYRDGKKAMEWEITDVVLFNELPDSVFAKP